jgi:hypothetical protein
MKKIFILFLCIALLLPAAGCGWAFRIGKAAGPGQAYDVNDHKELDMAGVDSVVITGVADDITVKAGGDKTVADLVGQCRTTGNPVHLETSTDGGALRIEVKYPGNCTFCDTKLTVTIPAGYRGGLSVTTVSGSIRAESLPFALEDVKLGTISGGIAFSTASYASLDAGTTSGRIEIGDIAAKTNAHTISGSISLDYAEMANTTASAVSGTIEASIPGSAVFSVDFGSISGSFRSTHPSLDVTSASHGFESRKDGAPLLKANTTSGNLRISGK